MRYRVRPGRQLAEVISAMPGGMSEKFLNMMAVPRAINGGGKLRLIREATLWEKDGECWSSVVTVPFPGQEPGVPEKRSVTLKLGTVEGVFLKEDSSIRKFSLGLVPGENGELVVRVPAKLQPKRIHQLACHTLLMVLRGTEWHDRNGRPHKSPCH